MDPASLFLVFIFLVCASVAVPLAKLAGLGPIIGYIASGVLIGPSVLGLIGRSDTVLHISEFGVVMMLFLIGLELRPAELWKMRAKLFGLGGLQVLLTVFALVAGMIAFSLGAGAAAALAMAFALSSTAVCLQIMQDRNLMQTTTGQSGFAILLFQDVIVIAMIALLPLVAAMTGAAPQEIAADAAHGHGEVAASLLAKPEGVWYGAALVGVLGGMILAGRLLLKPIFRLIARANVRETFTAIALALVVGASLLMGWLGLSAALGAFIGGVVLADSEYRHQLERDIEPFKALLLGLFFISVGMSLDLKVIAASPAAILLGVAALITAKMAVIYGVARLFKLSNTTAIPMAVLLSQAGELGFVLFQFARAEGLMDEVLITQASAIVALSMVLTPLLLIAHDRFIAPRLVAPAVTGQAPDHQDAPVLILGFGRVGQVAQRLLHTQDIETTLIDHDGDHIEFVRQFGSRVFYGDATDLDLLRLAGAAKAKVIIIAIDDSGQILRAAKLCKEHFPQAKLIVRAHNRNHMFELMALGVDFIERETVRAALAMGRASLRALGYSKERSDRLMDAFLRYDFQMIEESWQHRGDLKVLIQKAEDTREFLRRTLGDQEAEERVGEMLEEQLEWERNTKAAAP